MDIERTERNGRFLPSWNAPSDELTGLFAPGSGKARGSRSRPSLAATDSRPGQDPPGTSCQDCITFSPTARSTPYSVGIRYKHAAASVRGVAINGLARVAPLMKKPSTRSTGSVNSLYFGWSGSDGRFASLQMM